MAEVISVVCFSLLVVILVVLFEKKVHKTYLTPAALLIVPFVGVCLAWLIVGYPLGFVQPSARAILFFELCFFLFWAGGILATFAGPRRYCAPRGRAISKRELVWTKRLAFVTLVVVGGGLIFCLARLGGIAALGTYELQQTYGRGLIAHVRVLSLIPFIVLCSYLDRKDRWGWAICIGLLLCYFGYPVKSWIILPLVSAVIGRHLLFRWTPKASTVLWLSLASCAIFLCSYALPFWAWSGGDLDWGYTLRELNYHLLTYLFGGILAFGQVYESYGPPSWAQQPAVLFSSLVNIYHLFSGEPLLSPPNPYFVVIHPGLGKAVNVYTLFGSVWFHLRTAHTLAFAFVLGVFIYSLSKVAGSLNSPFLFAVSCFWLSALVFGWFEYYYWHLPFIELLVVAVFIEVVRRVHWGEKHKPIGELTEPSLEQVMDKDSLSGSTKFITHRALGERDGQEGA